MTNFPRPGGFRPPGPPLRPNMPPSGRVLPEGLGPDYLKNGYFDGNGNLWPELVTSEAERIAQVLGQRQGQAELKTAQLRRFYGKAKNAEQKLDSAQSFESVKSDVLTLQPLSANTVARGNAPQVFKDFIDRNVRLATKDENHFRKGFLVHFQSVVGYFTYHFRR